MIQKKLAARSNMRLAQYHKFRYGTLNQSAIELHPISMTNPQMYSGGLQRYHFSGWKLKKFQKKKK
jgi:hypothetical protein